MSVPGAGRVAQLEKVPVTKLKDLSLINPWDPHGGTRELGITSCSLIFTHVPQHTWDGSGILKAWVLRSLQLSQRALFLETLHLLTGYLSHC